MLFNSLSFFLFLAVVFAVYWGLRNRFSAQNLFILAVSYFFYACWDWRFLILIVASSFTDYFVGIRIHQETNSRTRKSWLLVSLVVNLGLLGFFKYFNFFIESATLILNAIGLEGSERSLSIILPVGISFYTFQTLSYTIDIYRGHIKPTRNLIQFFAFVSFFPQLVAGPIERASHLLPQFEKPRTFNHQFAVSGLRLILWGLFKKMVIADRAALIVEALYANPDECNSWMAAASGILFAFQVYCDFSGYSDIAIGSARLLGFSLMRNFVTPFLSSSMTEFWQRWHISLSTWFKDYLYIPLGGNRVSKPRWVVIILTTFTVSGLWHGADFHYVLWGFLCAIPLVFERLFKIRSIGVIPTFLLFSFLLIMFRSEGISSAITMYQNLFSLQFDAPSHLPKGLPVAYDLVYTSVFILMFSVFEFFMKKRDFDEVVGPWKRPIRWSMYYLLIAAISLFGVMDNAPQFIYFQF